MKRKLSIDAFRGLSILLVILLHCNIHMPISAEILPKLLFNFVFWNGYYAVILFFVISGYLITSTSLKRWGSLEQINYRQFYRLRFARIMPCLLALLAILSALDFFRIPGFTIQNTSLSQALLSTLTFQLNNLEAKISYLPANWDVLWSLSVEEIFYLFFPLACLILKKPRNIMIALCLFIIAGPISRVFYAGNEILSDRAYLCCMDGIAIGCITALMAGKIRIQKSLCLGLGIALLTWFLAFRKIGLMSLAKIGMDVTLLQWGMGFVLLSLQANPDQTNALLSRLLKPLRWFGRNSYEIYLNHSFFVILFSEFIYKPKESTLLTAALYTMVLVLSGVTGQVIARYFSEPMNGYLRSKARNEASKLEILPA